MRGRLTESLSSREPTYPTAAQLADVKAAGTYAVIAPQMGKQLVAFQARPGPKPRRPREPFPRARPSNPPLSAGALVTASRIRAPLRLIPPAAGRDGDHGEGVSQRL